MASAADRRGAATARVREAEKTRINCGGVDAGCRWLRVDARGASYALACVSVSRAVRNKSESMREAGRLPLAGRGLRVLRQIARYGRCSANPKETTKNELTESNRASMPRDRTAEGAGRLVGWVSRIYRARVTVLHASQNDRRKPRPANAFLTSVARVLLTTIRLLPSFCFVPVTAALKSASEV